MQNDLFPSPRRNDDRAEKEVTVAEPGTDSDWEVSEAQTRSMEGSSPLAVSVVLDLRLEVSPFHPETKAI
jgi:hypothetical protein